VKHGREAHGSLPVGKAQARYRPSHDDLVAKVEFRDDPFSRELFACYADGTLTGWSIRAAPHSQDCSPPTYDEIRKRPELERASMVYRSSTLLELSAVAIPGCASAVTLCIERGLISLPEGRRWLATGHLPDRPVSRSAPVKAPQLDAGLRVEYSAGAWLVYQRGDQAATVYSEDASALSRAGRLLKSFAMTGFFARSAPEAVLRPAIQYDAARERWIVQAPGGRVLGEFDDWNDGGLAAAGKLCKTASSGGLG
jgi:hypothetical protein